MAGTRIGGRRAAATNKQRYGLDFYRQIGRKGGRASGGGWFSPNYVDPHTGLTGPENASIVGKKGGAAFREKKLREAGE